MTTTQNLFKEPKSVHSVLAHLGYNGSSLIILTGTSTLFAETIKNTKTLYCIFWQKVPKYQTPAMHMD